MSSTVRTNDNSGTQFSQGMPRTVNFVPWGKKVLQHRLSQYSSPICFSFILVIASDVHLEPESENGAKTVVFHTTKNVHIQATRFLKF